MAHKQVVVAPHNLEFGIIVYILLYAQKQILISGVAYHLIY